jgi:sirohydrochlorin ferrochelatase
VKRAVLLVDHGSRRQEANEQLEELARRVRARLPDRIVGVAHLELVEPTIAQGIEACLAAGASEITVFPWFLGPGRHTSEDIPRHLAEAAARHPDVPIHLVPPLPLDDRLLELVLERIG